MLNRQKNVLLVASMISSGCRNRAPCIESLHK
jgi:hypothetical protein